ncbi:hypothetical protein EDD27_3371 [Nonomuraea polychroma]|uniref:Uncharacterized protein n=1 Tax=Nonomuraea polychroma TaxID=46176 RepID=A0A438M534_9ACTN|nr:hypothetical protein EDD27_3371 [Nonomuraea polychroma]
MAVTWRAQVMNTSRSSSATRASACWVTSSCTRRAKRLTRRADCSARARSSAGLGQQLDQEGVAGVPGHAEQHGDLLIRQPLIARDRGPELDRPGPHRPVLAVLARVEPDRQKAQILRPSQRIDQRRRHPPLQTAPRQELHHCPHDRVRGALAAVVRFRPRPARPRRHRLVHQPPHHRHQLRQARARPVHPMATAVRQVQRDPARVGLLSVERPARRPQPRQIRARLDMQPEILIIDHHPRHRLVGGHRPLRPVEPRQCT